MLAVPTQFRGERLYTQTLWWHEQVDTLQYVQEKLIAAILDALATPTDLPRHLAGDLRLLLFCLRERERETVSLLTKQQRLTDWQKQGRDKEGLAGHENKYDTHARTNKMYFTELETVLFITWCWSVKCPRPHGGETKREREKYKKRNNFRAIMFF